MLVTKWIIFDAVKKLLFLICIKRKSGDETKRLLKPRIEDVIFKNICFQFFMQPDNTNFRALKIPCSPWFLEFLAMNLKVNTVVQWIGTV